MKSTKKYFNSDNKFNKIVEARLGRRKAQSGINYQPVYEGTPQSNLLDILGAISTGTKVISGNSVANRLEYTDGYITPIAPRRPTNSGRINANELAVKNLAFDRYVDQKVRCEQGDAKACYDHYRIMENEDPKMLEEYLQNQNELDKISDMYSLPKNGLILGRKRGTNIDKTDPIQYKAIPTNVMSGMGLAPTNQIQAQNNAANIVGNEANQPPITPLRPPSAIENPALAAFQAAQGNFMGAARSRENLLEQQKLAEGKEDPFAAFAGEASGMLGKSTSGVPDVVSGQQAATTAANPIADMTTTGGAGSAGSTGKAMSKAGIPLAMVKSFGAAVSAGANDQDPTTYTGMEVAGDVLSLKFGQIGKKIKNREVARAARSQAEAAEKTAGQYASQAYDQAFSVTAPFTGQTYREDTGTRNRYISQSGGAADVSNLGYNPKGTTAKLPGGKAVSLGGGIVEYKGNSHEKGGILTGGKETIEVEGGELEVPAKTAEGGSMRYILSDYPKFAVNGETPADMVRNGKPIQEAVKINEVMASKIPTDFGGPADPSRSPDKFAQGGDWRTEDDNFTYRTQRPGYLDMGGNINSSTWTNIQNTDWGQYYGVTDQTTQAQLKEIYNNRYKTDVNRFYSPENKTQAIETLRLFAEQDTPAGDNFKRAFRGLDFGNPEHHQRILDAAKRKSTDGKIGAFHFIPALNAAEVEGEAVAGTATTTADAANSAATAAETTAEVVGEKLNVTEEEKKKIPGLGYKSENAVPGLAFLGMGAGLLPAFAPKIPPAELITGTPGIRAPRLPRENLKGQEAAVASDFAATIESLERAGNSSSGIYNNLLLKKLGADSQIAAQELSANKQLAGQEAGLRLRASEANMSAEIAKQARNADAINRREEFKQEQVRADLENITKNIQQGVADTMAYKSEKELADAIDVYDTRGYNRTLKMYQKERDKADKRKDTDSPFFGKTDDELRQAAQSEIQSRTGFDPEDKTLPIEQIMKMLELMAKTDQSDPKTKRAGGKKYFSKINKIRR